MTVYQSLGPDAPLAGATPVPPAHDARNLTRGGNLAQIALDGQIYTLRITRQGKLILTK
ncbi:hemin uptake protein HemP [Rhodobacter aestuarii]|uniref:Hemin uptake protein HemP n=1 Tax=Rhodobacter aestuarii TaxID=453582 RepID=A0A1N7MSK4_9RHOB|nr:MULTISPECIES: hemin uptake protein HemP [Rhodobacter]PTV96567.1 hemin uptake protein HemP [Rhodobacter aestuarii]SIS89030.1 Hemin uptake protein HemP [Rhodobacter aestuarii]SOB91494.1 hemin uptake protein HemP [Rhodobacter sp. JA431]